MNREVEVEAYPGWLMLLLNLMLHAIIIGLFITMVRADWSPYGSLSAVVRASLPWLVTLEILLVLTGVLVWCGFFIVEPNGSKVLLLFGSYKGTVKTPGFKWRNPFMSRRPVSLRARTLNGERLKVNDLSGNPVEIAAVVVWRVRDTYKAMFEVDHYEEYVAMQAEISVRHLASSYPYDADDDSVSLRRNADEISGTLRQELQERLEVAGLEVLDGRLSHLAYSPEIAGAMLRRQQAAAIIAARQRIVEGAVGMVEMAIERLEEFGHLQLDEERKAAMVSNLMVVLCSEHAAQPVVNTGTLYPG